jgi:hypothetical protein
LTLRRAGYSLPTTHCQDDLDKQWLFAALNGVEAGIRSIILERGGILGVRY